MNKVIDFEEFYKQAKDIANQVRNNYSYNLITTKLIENYINEQLYYELGILNNEIVSKLNGRSDILLLSLSNLVKNIAKHPNISKIIYLKSIDFINSSDALFFDRNNLKVFKTYENQLYEVVIKTTKSKLENYVLSIHYSYIRRQKNKKR